MAEAHHSPNIPSFDLGISDNEDISHLIVEDSLDKDEEIDTGEMMSNNNDEVTTKETELSNGIEDASAEQDFDLNKVPDEDVNSVNVCNDVEEHLKSDERAYSDLNRGVLYLNKLPDEGLDSGLESEELKKGIDDIIKIYRDSLSKCV